MDEEKGNDDVKITDDSINLPVVHTHTRTEQEDGKNNLEVKKAEESNVQSGTQEDKMSTDEVVDKDSTEMSNEKQVEQKDQDSITDKDHEDSGTKVTHDQHVIVSQPSEVEGDEEKEKIKENK